MEGEEDAGARKRKRGGQEDCADAATDVAEEVDDESRARGDAVGYEKAGPRLPLTEDADDDEACYDGIAEEAVAELMRWLEAEINAPDDDPAGFVTINGDEETCGPSFSSAASTVMASVDTRAGAPPPPPVPWPWPFAVPDAEAKREVATDAEMAGAAWLACGPALQGV